MAECNFAYAHYRDTLQRFHASGYTFQTFAAFRAEPQRAAKVMLLRHDIDKSVSKAVEMAKAEKDCGVAATYFFRVHSNYYNPFGHVCYGQIREIAALGHEIGLHSEFYDAAKINGEDAVTMFQREVTVLEAVTQQKCRSYSLHRTSGSSTIDQIQAHVAVIRDKFGVPSSYDEIYQKNFKYLSDSSGMWREGCFCGHVGKHARLHVLTHPDWWFARHIELEEPLV